MHNLFLATALERLYSRNIRQAIHEFKLYEKLSSIDTALGIENIATLKESLLAMGNTLSSVSAIDRVRSSTSRTLESFEPAVELTKRSALLLAPVVLW